MREVVMHTEEPVSPRGATERLIKILDITYVKAEIEQVPANTTQLNHEERNQLLRPIRDFEDLFDGTLGYWDIEPVDLEVNTNHKPFHCKYHLIPRINKEIFCKDLECLVK